MGRKKLEKSTLVIEIPEEMHQQLRWLSFNMRISMAEICRRGLEYMIEKNEKKFPAPPS